jgi:hypothetical protein
MSKSGKQAQGGDQDTAMDELSKKFYGCKVGDSVDPQFQAVKVPAFTGRELPTHIKLVRIDDAYYLVITKPTLTEEERRQLVATHEKAVMASVSPPRVGDAHALFAACIGMQMKHDASQCAATFGGEVLTNKTSPKKFPTLEKAYHVLGIPFLNGADKPSVGSEPAHQLKHPKAAGKDVKHHNASNGQVGAKAADGAFVDMAALKAAKDVVKFAGMLKRAQEKFTKAVSAGGGDAAVSDKEVKAGGDGAAGGGGCGGGKVAAGGGVAVVVKEHRAAAGGGSNSLKAVRPSAGGGCGGGNAAADDGGRHATKRRTHDGRQ